MKCLVGRPENQHCSQGLVDSLGSNVIRAIHLDVPLQSFLHNTACMNTLSIHAPHSLQADEESKFPNADLTDCCWCRPLVMHAASMPWRK